MDLNLRKTLIVLSTFGSNVTMKIVSISHSYLNTPLSLILHFAALA